MSISLADSKSQGPCFYCMQTKLRKGNVFTGVSINHSVHRDRSTMWSLPMMHWDMGPTPPRTATGIWWSLLETCVNLRTPHHHYQCWRLVMATETRTVGKWAVHILLEFILILNAMVLGNILAKCRVGAPCSKSWLHPCVWLTVAAWTEGERRLMALASNWKLRSCSGADNGRKY